jgi:anti-sigma factor RsiW
VAYWAGDLAADEEQALEEHLVECPFCTAESARVAAVTETLRAVIPPVVTRAQVEGLRAKGMRVRESAFVPGERREEAFPRDVDLMIFHLTRVDLERAARVQLTVSVESSGELLSVIEETPFDEGTDELLVCCQRHFASLPTDIVFEVLVREIDGRQHASKYTILHRME